MECCWPVLKELIRDKNEEEAISNNKVVERSYLNTLMHLKIEEMTDNFAAKDNFDQNKGISKHNFAMFLFLHIDVESCLCKHYLN